MPKVSEKEWGEFMDPESEEYSPSSEDLEEERKNEEAVKHELYYIDHEIRFPGEDKFTRERNNRGHSSVSPESLWERLDYLKTDHLDKIKDKESREKLQKQISKVEQTVYRQFLPFLRGQVHIFGLGNSPLEKYRSDYRINSEEISSYFDQARSVVERQELTEEEKSDFLNSLSFIQENFEKYQNEPTLFTFEKIAQEIQEETFARDFIYYRQNKDSIPLGTKESLEDELLRLKLLLVKAHELKEIASRMLVEEIKKECELTAKSFIDHIEYKMAEAKAPQEVLAVEGELRDLFQRAKSGEKIGQEALNAVESRTSEVIKNRAVDKVIAEKLNTLLDKIKRVAAGETIDEEEERFKAKTSGDIYWAWTLLGVDRNASEAEVKKAKKRLAGKYHPDRNPGDKVAEEKLRQVNEAFEIISDVGGYK